MTIFIWKMCNVLKSMKNQFPDYFFLTYDWFCTQSSEYSKSFDLNNRPKMSILSSQKMRNVLKRIFQFMSFFVRFVYSLYNLYNTHTNINEKPSDIHIYILRSHRSFITILLSMVCPTGQRILQKYTPLTTSSCFWVFDLKPPGPVARCVWVSEKLFFEQRHFRNSILKNIRRVVYDRLLDDFVCAFIRNIKP